MKNSLVHGNFNAHPQAVRVLVSTAISLMFQLFAITSFKRISKALKNYSKMSTLNPQNELKIPPEKLLRVLKPFYGLADSGDYWGRTFKDHLRSDLELRTAQSDCALFLRSSAQNVDCLYGADVDEFSSVW